MTLSPFSPFALSLFSSFPSHSVSIQVLYFILFTNLWIIDKIIVLNSWNDETEISRTSFNFMYKQ